MRKPDYSGANYGGSQQYWHGPRGASGGNPDQGYVYFDRNWVPASEHPGLQSYQYPMMLQAGSEGGNAPYYANDVSSALMQQAFPGAVAGYGFSSSQLEPRRQAGIMELLRMTGQAGANSRANSFQAGVGQRAMDFARNSGAMMYGPGGGGRNFQASSLLAAQNNGQGVSNMYRAQTTDPMALAQQRQQIIMQGYNNPLADQVRGWMPGLEPQRQNNNFWSQIAGVGSQILPYMNFGGGGRRGGADSWMGGSNTSTDSGGNKWW